MRRVERVRSTRQKDQTTTLLLREAGILSRQDKGSLGRFYIAVRSKLVGNLIELLLPGRNGARTMGHHRDDAAGGKIIRGALEIGSSSRETGAVITVGAGADGAFIHIKVFLRVFASHNLDKFTRVFRVGSLFGNVKAVGDQEEYALVAGRRVPGDVIYCALFNYLTVSPVTHDVEGGLIVDDQVNAADPVDGAAVLVGAVQYLAEVF